MTGATWARTLRGDPKNGSRPGAVGHWKETTMPKYLIQREVPGVGRLTPDALHDLSARSNAVLAELGSSIQWVQSYVTGDQLFCVYNATGEDQIREHARLGGFACDAITQVTGIIDPVTGED